MSIEQDNRQNLILRYIKKHPSATQDDILNHLEKLDSCASQATVARDLKDLGYRKVKGKYIKTKKKLESEQEAMLKNLIAYDESRIFDFSTSLFRVVISTKKGMEQSIADLIHKIYENYIVGILVGCGCVIVITTSQTNATRIEKKLKSYKSDSIQ